MIGLERKLVYTASDEFRMGTCFNPLKAAHEVISAIQRKRGRSWRDAWAVIARHLGGRPGEVNVPDDWEKWDVEGAFWVRTEEAINGGGAGRFPE